MTNSSIVVFAIAFLILTQLATGNIVDATMSIKEDFTKTTITLNETVKFSVEVNFPVNITWYCNDARVQSDYASVSNYTFVPVAIGIYYIKLSVAGFTKPSGPTKVTVLEQQIITQNPTLTPTPMPYPVPTPHSTYHKGDSYTTVYSPSEIAPPNGTKLPKITIKSPTNKTLISNNNFTVTFSLALEGAYPITLRRLYYKSSWQTDNGYVDFNSLRKYSNETLTSSIPFSNVPEGKQVIAINADIMSEFGTGTESVRQPVSGVPNIPPYGNYVYVYSNYYLISGQSFVDFTVDTSPAAVLNPTSGDSTPILKVEAVGLTAVIVTVLVVGAVFFLYTKHRTSKLT